MSEGTLLEWISEDKRNKIKLVKEFEGVKSNCFLHYKKYFIIGWVQVGFCFAIYLENSIESAKNYFDIN